MRSFLFITLHHVRQTLQFNSDHFQFLSILSTVVCFACAPVHMSVCLHVSDCPGAEPGFLERGFICIKEVWVRSRVDFADFI